MRIISKFKDHYDFAQPYYDGGANSVTFDRFLTKNTKAVSEFLSRNYTIVPNWSSGSYYDFPEIIESNFTTHYHLAIADKIVSFYKIAEHNEPPYFSTERGVHQIKANRYVSNKTTIPVILETEKFKKVVELQEEFNTPIVLFYFGDNGKTLFIESNPRLVDYHINNILDANQVHQEIEMWLTNHNNKTPISNITDPEKIVSHGFDKKTSFRHPIK